jgi:hypothetical protein
MLPADVTALKVTVPGPQLAPPVVAVITGVALITKLVAALQPLPLEHSA